MDEALLSKLVVEHGLLSPQQVLAVQARRRSGDGRSFEELLLASGLLTASDLAKLTAASGAALRARDTLPDQEHGPVSARAPSGRGVPALERTSSGRGTAAPDRAAVIREVQKVLATDPLFYPLAELVLVPEQLLGEGGMGVVHKVLDPRLGRRAALKLVKGVASDIRAKRFLREAIITARLDHPGIPPVYEAGKTASGQLFLLMRFVDGESLASILDPRRTKPPLELRELIGILVKVGEAISYAHSRRIVHRDLKPENIMVGSFGEVLVMDWGLARNLDESQDDLEAHALAQTKVEAEKELKPDSKGQRPHLTREGAVLGTLGYMPPEQAKSAEVDERADVFALGATLTEVLSGKPPITATSFMAALSATLEAKIVLPRQRRRDVAPELDAIAARALAAKPGDRYPSVKAFTDDLRAFLEGRNVSVYGYGKAEQALRLVRRHPTIFAAGAVAILASLVAAASLWVKNQEIAEQSAKLERKNVELTETVVALEKEKKDRAEADRRRLAAEKGRDATERSLALLEEARSDFQRGAAISEIRKRTLDAVAASRTEGVLLAAGRLLCECGDMEAGAELLRACSDEFRPGYRALFALHELETRGQFQFLVTKPLEELVARAKARGDENEYTCLMTSVEAFRRGDPDAALEGAKAALAKAPRFAAAYAFAGEAKIQKKDETGALAEFDRALEIEPRYAAVLSERGVIRRHQGDTTGALADLDLAISIAPSFSHFWINRGTVKAVRGDAKGALADFEHATKLTPPDADAFYNRGHQLALAGDAARALADFKKALEINPTHVASLVSAGTAYLDLGALDEAISYYEQAIAADPQHASAWCNRGCVLLRKGDLDGAIRDGTKALALDAQVIEARFLLSEARFAKGDAGGALREAQGAVDAAPRSAQALTQHASVLLRTGKLDAAVEDLDRAIGLDARYELAWIDRGQARAGKGDLAGAISDYDKAIEINPRAVGSFIARAQYRAKKDDLAGAISDCERALSLDPKSIAGFECRAYFELETGDMRAALADAERCAELGPGFAETWNCLAFVKLAKGDGDGALVAATKAVELDGKMAYAWNNHGEARLRRGDKDGAATDIEQALKLDPTNAYAWKNRALLKIARRDLDGALEDAKKAIEIDPRLATARTARAEALAAKGDPRGAAEELSRALPLVHDPAEAARIRARMDELRTRGGG